MIVTTVPLARARFLACSILTAVSIAVSMGLQPLQAAETKSKVNTRHLKMETPVEEEKTVVTEEDTTTVTKTQPHYDHLPKKAAQAETNCIDYESVTDRDDVYTNVNQDVLTPIPPCPEVVAPVDVLKLQINSRMNGGLMSGTLTNEHADAIRAWLDDISLQEANFKLACNGVLTLPASNNLMRKYQMINQRLDDYLSKDVVSYMPSFELRRMGIQRRIHYHVAAGDISPIEGEQLLTALSQVSDQYTNYLATGGALTATELESLHRDLSLVYAKMTERCGAKLAFCSPATYDKLAELKHTIGLAIASNRFSAAETKNLTEQYNGLVLTQSSLSKCSGIRSEDVVLLAKQIDNLNFILTRILHDREIAGHCNKL
jgi:hypothetical protein